MVVFARYAFAAYITLSILDGGSAGSSFSSDIDGGSAGSSPSSDEDGGSAAPNGVADAGGIPYP